MENLKSRLFSGKHLIKICVFAIFFFSTDFCTYAYMPPMGIPDPGLWGSTHPIDSQAPEPPADWSVPLSGYYYIDGLSGNDSNGNGCPNAPRKSFPSSLNEGAYVEIHGTFTSRAEIRANGSAESPIWLRGSSSSPALFSSVGMVIRESDYLIIENIVFNGGMLSVGSANAINHIAVRNCDLGHSNSSLMEIGAAEGDIIHDVVIYDCVFHDTGDWETTEDEDYHGINPNTWSGDSTSEVYNVWILGNTFYQLSGDGVQVNAGNWQGSHEALHSIYIGGNTSYKNRQSGFYCKQATDVVISQNTIWGMRMHGSQQGSAIGILYSPDRLWIIFNTIYDCNNGIRQGDCTVYPGGGCSATDHSLYIIGNKIYNIHNVDGVDNGFDYLGCGIKLYWGAMKRYVVDNTIYDTRIGIQAIQWGPLDISGNIICEISDHIDGAGNYWHLYIHGNVAQNTDVDYLSVYDESGKERIFWAGTTSTSLSSWTGAVATECKNWCSDSDPQMVSPPDDISLKASSPCLGKNIKHPAYDEFQNRYNLSIFSDYEGVERTEDYAIVGASSKLVEPTIYKK